MKKLSVFWFVSLLAVMASVLRAESQGSVTISSVSSDREEKRGREHMIENQSKNMGIFAVPAPGPVVIDGDLSDWDWSGRVISFADYTIREKYSVETAMMWDEEYFYVAFRWFDESPASNHFDPEFDAQVGWKGDSFAMRTVTDKTFWLTGWNFTGEDEEIIEYKEWNNPKSLKEGTQDHYYISEPGGVDIGEGMQMQTRVVDGGYVQEIRVPWAKMYQDVPTIADGLRFKMGIEYIWGTPEGTGFPQHRYADNLQPGTDNRLFFWTATNAWGDVVLIGRNGIPLRQYSPLDSQMVGPVEISLEIPKGAKRFTVVVDDESGIRVRNLVGDVDPRDFAVSESEETYTVQVRWDGRDEFGEVAPVGQYQVRGLWHDGIGAYLDTVFYNPGSPPWKTADSSGDWGADHHPASLVSRAGDGMTLACRFAEGGDGIIAIGDDGTKAWGAKRGAVALTADADHTYAITTQHFHTGNLCRFSNADGSYAPFEEADTPVKFDVPLDLFIPGFQKKEKKGSPGTDVLDMAISDDSLYFALSGGRLVSVDKNTLELRTDAVVAGLERVSISPEGIVFGLAENQLFLIDPASGESRVVPTPGLAEGGDLSVSPEGLIAVMDGGPDQQIKIYRDNGERVAELARKGGRPIRGDFDPEAVSHVSSIEYDSDGLLWATESWDYPRRISVWNPDGSLAKDYIGNTRYGATGSYLHDEDPELAYVGPIEMILDRENHTYEVTQILWVSDPDREDEPESFTISTHDHAVPSRFRSSAGGVEREFLFDPAWVFRSDPSVLYMEDENGWRPVSAVGYVGQISGEINRNTVVSTPTGDFADLDAKDGFFWNDLNEDGRVQRDECVIVPAKKNKKGETQWAEMHFGSFWNNNINREDLSFLVGEIYRYSPVGFTEKGAPLYGPDGVEEVLSTQFNQGYPYGIYEDEVYVTFYRRERPNLAGYDMETKEMLWSYPNDFSGVHGSHKAPMAAPGMLIGVLKVLGHAEVEGLGYVFAMRGNQGEDYYMTSDGLYVGSVFSDSRITENNLGSSIEDSKGYPLQGQPDEPFSGCFMLQSDGVYRNVTSLGKQSAIVVEVRGLESIKRFVGPQFEIGPEEEEILQDYEPKLVASEGEKVFRIDRVQKPLPLDSSVEWSSLNPLTIQGRTTNESATVKMAYDADFLYVAFEVSDRSPRKNSGRDFKRLFKTGDGVDLQLSSVDGKKRQKLLQEDSRLFFSFQEGEPTAVLLKPVDPEAPDFLGHTYDSSVGPKEFDRVEQIEDLEIVSEATVSQYTVRSRIPWALLDIQPTEGQSLYGDVGFISSDEQGTRNVARTYWSNRDTGLVSDEPLEAWLFPALWGEFILGE